MTYMSSEALVWASSQEVIAVVINGSKISVAAQRSILFSLANRHNYKTNLCFPSISLLCQESGMGSNNTALRSIDALSQQGIISVRREGRRTSSFYEFNGLNDKSSSAPTAPLSSAVSAPTDAVSAPLSSALSEPSSALSDASSAVSAPSVVQSLHPNPTKHNPTINPSFNPTFGDFWKLYPKKRAKGYAEKTWDKQSTADQAMIISHLQQRVGNDSSWVTPKYIPHPATFLNGKGWLDEWDRVTGFSDQTARNIQVLMDTELP